MKFCMFASIFSIVSLPYSVMSFIWVTVESGIIMIFAPDSIHPDCLALSVNFLLNRWIDFDYLLNNSESLRIALLKSLMPMVDV